MCPLIISLCSNWTSPNVEKPDHHNNVLRRSGNGRCFWLISRSYKTTQQNAIAQRTIFATRASSRFEPKRTIISRFVERRAKRRFQMIAPGKRTRPELSSINISAVAFAPTTLRLYTQTCASRPKTRSTDHNLALSQPCASIKTHPT